MPSKCARGFTLIELLVALAAMSLLAIMSWRGLDGMVRAQTQTRTHADAVLTLRASLAQWNADLDGIADLKRSTAIDWDGKALRLTRRASDTTSPALYVVAWTGDGASWRRWQSPPVATRGDWQQAWDAAASWARDGARGNGTETTLIPLSTWQISYFRDDAWGPPTLPTSATGAAKVPNGLRLVLELPPGPGLSGRITRDWVRPNLTMAPKS